MAAVIAILRAARPKFRNGMDKLAFAVHGSFLAAGYRLVAVGAAAEDEAPGELGDEHDVGVEGWDLLEDRYAFRYLRDGEPPQRVIVKALAMDEVLMVDATSGAEAEPPHVELRVVDYTTDSTSSDFAAQYRNLDQLSRLVDTQLISHLARSISEAEKAGPVPNRAGGTAVDQGLSLEDQRRRPSSLMEGPPRRGGTGVPVPGMPGVEIPGFGGGDDLNPFGGGGVMPPRFGGGGGGSMLLGPHDPRWGVMPGGEQLGGYPPGVLPPGVPPGARFDPYGPPGIPGFEPGRFGDGGRPSGRGGPPSHPDMEFFPPH